MSYIDCWIPALHIAEFSCYKPAPIRLPWSLQLAGHVNVKTEPGSPKVYLWMLMSSIELSFVSHSMLIMGGYLALLVSFGITSLVFGLDTPSHTISTIWQFEMNVLGSGFLNNFSESLYSGILFIKLTLSLCLFITWISILWSISA